MPPVFSNAGGIFIMVADMREYTYKTGLFPEPFGGLHKDLPISVLKK